MDAKAILNVAAPENFERPHHSQYSREVWDAKPCPVGDGEFTHFGSASYVSKPCPL